MHSALHLDAPHCLKPSKVVWVLSLLLSLLVLAIPLAHILDSLKIINHAILLSKALHTILVCLMVIILDEDIELIIAIHQDIHATLQEATGVDEDTLLDTEGVTTNA